MTAIERKQNTERLLKTLNIPFIDHLPLIEEEHEARIRTPQEIAKRILVLTYLNYVSEEPDDREEVIEFLKEQELWDSVSSNEKVLFTKDLSDQEHINISWRSEAIWLLLWVINVVDTINLPTEEVSIPQMLELLPDFMTDTKGFIQSASIRTVSEILDLSDLTYRLHWATRHTELNNLETLDLNSSIIQERHYAINWVTYYEDNWDDITTDT
ncbi:MAG TPA: DUF4272 domain-containing protein [Chitinophagaceae bacterium]|nr:DUF4272 domain-containing protein [Chitinophagaceae bacterium]